MSDEPAAVPELGPIRKRFALLVGVNRFDDATYPRLRYCVNDVTKLATVLDKLGYDVTSLHDDQEAGYQPTRSAILAELKRICAAASAPQDLILVHIATHGMLAGKTTMLIAGDTRHIALEGTSLLLEEVESTLRASPARRLILSLDACHTGFEGSLTRYVPDPKFIDHVYDSAEGFAVMAATTSEALAYELPEEKHGLFSHFLIKALEGGSALVANRITLANVQNYILNGMASWAEDRKLPHQVPRFRANGYGDIVMAEVKAATVSGNPFSDYFNYGRELDFEEVFEELEKGNSVVLLGPEQIGKTHLLDRVYENGPQLLPGREFHQMTLAYVETPEEFYLKLKMALQFERVLRGVMLNEALTKRRVVLCIDELERLGGAEFRDLTWLLRGLSNGKNTPLRMVATARSELKDFLGSGGKPSDPSSLASAFQPVRLHPFDEDEVKDLLQQRLAGTQVTFTPEEIRGLTEKSGGVPGRLRALAYDLFRAKRRGRKS